MMRTSSSPINSRLLNILLLYTGMFAVTSCEPNEVIEQAIPSAVLTRGISLSSIPTDFFHCSNVALSPIIETLQGMESENPFIDRFQEEYGIPLWDYTYSIEEEKGGIYFVPLYNNKALMEINAIWFFHVADGRMTYGPFKRDADFLANSEQRFLFDLLSYLVFGVNNASGYIFKEQTPQTRAWIIVTTCWDVYTGHGSEENLTYSYTNCIDKAYWVDEFLWNGSQFGTGFNEPTGGYSGSPGGSSTSPAQTIFRNDNLSKDTWTLLNNLFDEILENCMGMNLYSSIRNQLNEDKMKIIIVDGLDSGYNWNNKTLLLNVNHLESNVFLHELIHLYQTLKESTSSFEGALLNREIEAHYAQYLFLKKQPIWEEKYKDIYNRNSRGRATLALEEYFDEHGRLKDESVSDMIEVIFSEQVIPSFRKTAPYKSYPYDNSQSILQLFSNINILTKNCN